MRHIVFASLITTSLAGAQVTARLESGSTGIRVDACGAKTFPKGKDMGTKFSLATNCAGSGAASYTATITAGPTLGIVGSAKPNYNPTVTCSTGPNKVILTWTATKKVTGFLRVIALATVTGPANRVSQSVDIGDDGKVEFSALSHNYGHTRWAYFPVTIDSKGLRIGIETSTSQSFHRYVPTTTGSLSVSFLPTRCGFTRFGTGCGSTGPQLSGSEIDPWGAYLTHTGGLANGLGMMAVGLKSLDVPLPSSGCRLHTDLLILQPLTLPPWTVRIRVLLPKNFQGPARVQFFSYHTPSGVLDIRSSNGLLLTCR